MSLPHSDIFKPKARGRGASYDKRKLADHNIAARQFAGKDLELNHKALRGTKIASPGQICRSYFVGFFRALLQSIISRVPLALMISTFLRFANSVKSPQVTIARNAVVWPV
jgi:hypothetical protein